MVFDRMKFIIKSKPYKTPIIENGQKCNNSLGEVLHFQHFLSSQMSAIGRVQIE